MWPRAQTTTTGGPHAFAFDSISAFSGAYAKAHAYALISREISALQGLIRVHEMEIRRWKTQYNRLSNISRLPTEILIHIFQLLPPRRDFVTPSQILKASHVCTSWRQTLFSYPSLWKIGPYTGKQNPASLAVRRRQYPGPMLVELDCTVDRSYGYEIPNVELSKWSHYGSDRVKTNSRIEATISQTWDVMKAISVSCAEDYDWLGPEICGMLLRRAPSLETVTIMFSEPPSPENFPDTLIGDAPRLRHVYLRNWNLLMNPTLLSPIRFLNTLDIHLESRCDSHLIQVSEAIPLLQHFPCLELLKLYKVFAPVEDVDLVWSLSNPAYIIHLPTLRRLTISDEPSAISFFSKHVTYPPETIVFGDGSWEVTAEQSGSDDGSWEDGTQQSHSDGGSGSWGNAAQRSDQTEMTEFLVRASKLARNPIHALRATVSNGPSGRFETELMTTPVPVGWLKDTADITANCPYTLDVATNIFRSLRLDALQELSIFLCPYRPIDIDWKLLGQLPQLRFIVTSPITPDFASTLTLPIRSDTTAELYFPWLEEIRIHDTRFWSKKSHQSEPRTTWEALYSFRVEDLSACISFRRNRGYGPYNVGLEASTKISDDDMDLLQAAFTTGRDHR